MVLVGTCMALYILYTKPLKCSFYRHACFLLYGKIYNPLCFLSFSMPCFPTLEINLLDEAVSNHFLRSKKNISSPMPFFCWTVRGFQTGFFLIHSPPLFFFFFSPLRGKKILWRFFSSFHIFPVNRAQFGLGWLTKMFTSGFGNSRDHLVQPPSVKQSARASCSRLYPIVFEYLHGLWLHSISAQSVPVFTHHYNIKVFLSGQNLLHFYSHWFCHLL